MLISEFAKSQKLDFSNKDEIKAFNQIFSNILGFEFKDLITKWDYELSKKQMKLFSKKWKVFKNGKPLAYITKSSYFYNTEISVNKNVLIPRLETEYLVSQSLEFAQKNFLDSELILADICTGSGAIGVSFLSDWEKVLVFSSDISQKAIKVARKNFSRFDKDNFIIERGNFLNPLIKSGLKANILTINPPYIDQEDQNVDPKTFKNEPHLALFAKNKGMHFYEEFFKYWEQVINFEKPFFVIMEFGFDQKEKIESLAKENLGNYNWKIQADYFNNWRYLIIS
ncbi:peptide chain release factor N(5)-glutamine methyltransferase [Spiroplasma endosymbiont of Panorpa germanica]|uniref:peptide chain release factor N(5)-glutamine methyltransferase n=1 Tax=Spiroplasma endosymbiont of Panorpa germanica TaxID=3066314 RepID=UPI0030D450B7